MYNRVVAWFKRFQTKDINNYHIEYSITGNGRFSHEGSKLAGTSNSFKPDCICWDSTTVGLVFT